MRANVGTAPALVKVPEVAQMLGISRAMVYKLMDTGRLSYVKLGSARRVEVEAVRRLIDGNRIGDSSTA